MSEARILFPRLIQYHRPTDPLWLSGTRNKLAADGLDLSAPLLLLLAGGTEFYYRSYRSPHSGGVLSVSAKSPHAWRHLSVALGLYLEDFRTVDPERLYGDIKKNLLLRVAPPMLEVPAALFRDSLTGDADGRDLMLLVAGFTADDSALILIHPQRPEYLTMPLDLLADSRNAWPPVPGREAQRGYRWVMQNAPSFAKPVFPALPASLLTALESWATRFLHLPNLPVTIGLTGRQAFDVCVADLAALAEEADEGTADWEAQVDAWLELLNGESPLMFGRDLQAEALREASALLGLDLEAPALLFDDAAHRWRAFSRQMRAAKQDGPYRLEEAARTLLTISEIESAAATLLTGLAQPVGTSKGVLA